MLSPPINRTIFGIETRSCQALSASRRCLSIAPSLELKPSNWRFAIVSAKTINRTIFGIETTKPGEICCHDNGLSIAPSLELKHSWNAFYDYARDLSIAPSLELKPPILTWLLMANGTYQSHHLWNWNEFQQRRKKRWNPGYQSHHLWNWNTWSVCTRWVPTMPINRTIFGIETIDARDPPGATLPINRTIFGIETDIRLWVCSWQ